MYICSSGIISVRPKQYRLCRIGFLSRAQLPIKARRRRFHTAGGKSGGGKRHSGNQYEAGIINSALKWQRKQGCDAFTLMLQRGLHFVPANPLLLITPACLGPNGAVPHTHTHGLIANPCKGQLLLCAEPAVTRRVRRLQQTAAVTMINHLALSFTCR